MKVTYNWLKEFVDFDLTVQQLADLLTMLGLEVEAMVPQGNGMDDVVVAVVEEKLPHPNADKLSLCRVNNGTEVLGVVCGAQNFKQGDSVALALIGATLPGNLKIKRSKIRGEESFGMLCSEKELGLAEDSAGIMVLAEGLRPGTPVLEALGLKDTLMEIGLTPNRADCLSVVGIAREIAAKLGHPIQRPDTSIIEGSIAADGIIGVSVEDTDLCQRYAARYVSGCRIAPSPAWLVNRLAAVGMRSINNVVDVTNLVMMELGHPLHAFDSDRLEGRRIVVRRAVEGELFTTLDDQSRQLTADDLVICDSIRPVALAGVMGGQNSEISDSTTNILLESAFFKPSCIRKTSKRLGLHTESSHRFERGADICMVPLALDRAASLIAKLSGGIVAQGVVDKYSSPLERIAITLRPERVGELLGILFDKSEIIDILNRLECKVSQLPDNSLSVVPPSYRIDIEREIDLVEEIARLKGFDAIPATLPTARVISDRPSLHQCMERKVRDLLVSQGMNEIINFSFTSPDAADKLMLKEDDPRRKVIRLVNPLIVEQSVMRTSLLPGVLETVVRNINFRSMDLKLFEIRRTYLPTAEEMAEEPLCIAGALTGTRSDGSWNSCRDLVDFYDVKGIVENLLTEHITNVIWVADVPETYYHPGKSCSIMAGKERIGTLGELHPTVQGNFGLERPVYCFEINFDKLLTLSCKKENIKAPSRFPDSARDIAVLAPEELPFEQILQCVDALKIREIVGVEVFDVYRGTGIAQGYKSIAIRIRYGSDMRTLIDDEISSFHAKVMDVMVKKLNLTIR